MEYLEFLKSKKISVQATGFDIKQEDLNQLLFDFQKDCVKWALKKGKSALFEGTGLGKTAQYLEWAKHVCAHANGNVLILAPLAVSNQTDMMIQEAAELIQAITNERRGRNENDNLIEEMVDCQIMLNQMRIIVNDESKYERWMAYKLDKLQGLIESSQEQYNRRLIQ